MFSTLCNIVKDNVTWRKRIANLALFELKKKSRGAVLSWVWFFIKPLMYVFCFWFALEVGLRVGNGAAYGEYPYILWLSAGLVPWFFIQDMLGPGVDVLHRYPYLVNKIKFPLSAISSIFTVASMIVQVMLICALLILNALCGAPFDWYLLQLVPLVVLMLLFWNTFSILFSQLSAMSKDVKNLLNAFSTPVFWLSGVLFDVERIPVDWIHYLFALNPVTFFASGYRDAFYNKVWFWENPTQCIGFAVVFLVTLLLALVVYKRFNEEVSDVL